MKSFKKTLVIVLMLCAVTAVLTVGAWADTLSPITLVTGDSTSATAYPSEGWSALSYQWTTDNPAVVSLSNTTGSTVGISGIASGVANVHCEVSCEHAALGTGTKQIDVQVTVNPPRPSFGIYADPANVNYLIGVSSPVAVSAVNKQNMDGYTVNWVVENNGAVGGANPTIGDNITVSYTAPGTSVVKAYVVYGNEQVWADNSVQINVSSVTDPTGVSVAPKDCALAYGNGTTIRASVSPDNATYKKVTFTTSDPTIIECTDNGDNTAFIKRISDTGNAIITAVVDGYPTLKAQCIVTASDPEKPGPGPEEKLGDFAIYEHSDTMTVGSTKQLYTTQGGANVTTITDWFSSDPNTVEVDNVNHKGLLTAKKPGTVTIYAQNEVGSTTHRDSCTITVTGYAPFTAHTITYGNYSTFDGVNPLYFMTNDAYSNFTGVAVDGYALTNYNQYRVDSSPDGHILVTMNPAFMKQLSSGNYHTIQIASANGVASGYFRTYGVSYNIYGVRTGDDNNIALWAVLCAIGFIGSTAIIIKKRKDIFG